jgi:hypothetical protein
VYLLYSYSIQHLHKLKQCWNWNKIVSIKTSASQLVIRVLIDIDEHPDHYFPPETEILLKHSAHVSQIGDKQQLMQAPKNFWQHPMLIMKLLRQGV